MNCRECHTDLPADARYCIECAAPVVADGATARLEKPRRVLGYIYGEPVYEYDKELWERPAFIVVHPFMEDAV